MTQRPFRHHHTLEILQAFDPDRGPLDSFMHQYFRKNSALGSKDRREVAELIYGVVRWQLLLDALYEGEKSWERRLSTYLEVDLGHERENEDLPAPVRCSFPEELFTLIVESLGEERALEVAFASNTPAPTTIRTNTLKVSREELLASLKERAAVEPTEQSPLGIRFRERLPLFSLEEFQKGWFEVQDEGSQLLADMVEAQPGEHILDYCAGAGGKSLAIAPRMQGKGQLYLYDIREHALREARKRLKRAGAQNVQFLDRGGLKRLKGKMDCVLIDAPCSGTGTLRRNPDMKQRFQPAFLEELIQTQREIVEQALRYLKPGGTLVYATCSILVHENERQVKFFEREFGLIPFAPPFSSLPSEGGMDGFFAQKLKRVGE